MKYVESENVSVQEQLSALHDGELSRADAAALVRASLDDDGVGVMLQWRSMSAISAVLREQQSGTVAHSVASGDAAVRPALMPQREAANDGLFRWKMVAGVAAFAAVGSLAWALLGGVGALGEKALAQGGVMAQSQNAPTINASATSASGQARVAFGGQKSVQIDGQEVTMIRDSRLDELLAAHRQFGGSSALQQPAGSLRSVSLGAARP